MKIYRAFQIVNLSLLFARTHLRNVLKLLAPSCEIIVVDGLTAGAVCTALLAIEHINNETPLVIANADQLVEVDLCDVIQSFEQQSLDAGTLVFDSVHPRWSYVRLDEHGYVIEAAEKRPISRYATAGIYYFREGRRFVKAAMEMIKKTLTQTVFSMFAQPSMS